MKSEEIIKMLIELSSPEKAKTNAWFFKTGKGQYGEGDQFLGLTVPQVRSVAKKASPTVSLSEIEKLIKNKYHEVRLCALALLVDRFNKEPERVYKTYIKNLKYINNWDLVDISAGKIVGNYIYRSQEEVLTDFAHSSNLWKKRIAIVSTFHHISRGEDARTYEIAEILLHDKEDLIQKAVGWLLREAGKRVSEQNLIKFLNKHSKVMPRTMLRYAIERFDPEIRKKFLLGEAVSVNA